MKRLKFVTIFLALAAIVRARGLTIDNQLVIIANDCYTRVAIGSRISSRDSSFNTEAATVSDCENECSRLRRSCDVFSFGISSKGNGTCLIGSSVPNPQDLQADSDYDVYVRRQDSPDCEPDRLYQLGSGGNKQSIPNDKRKPPEGDGRPEGFGNGADPPRPGGFQKPRPIADDRRPPYGGEPPSEDDRRYPHNDRKPGEDWMSLNDDRRQNHKAPYGDGRPPYEDNKQFHGHKTPSYDANKNSHDDRRPPVDDRRPPYGDRRPDNDRGPSSDNEGIPRPGGFGTFSIGRPSDDSHPVTTRPNNLFGTDREPDDNDRRPFDDVPRPISIGQRPIKDDLPRPEVPNAEKPQDRYENRRPGNGPSNENEIKYPIHHEGGDYYSGTGQSYGHNDFTGYHYPKPMGNEVIIMDQNNPNRPFVPQNSYGFYGYSPNGHKGPEDERFEDKYTGSFLDYEPIDKYDFGNQLDDKYHYSTDSNNRYGISVYEQPKYSHAYQNKLICNGQTATALT